VGRGRRKYPTDDDSVLRIFPKKGWDDGGVLITGEKKKALRMKAKCEEKDRTQKTIEEDNGSFTRKKDKASQQEERKEKKCYWGETGQKCMTDGKVLVLVGFVKVIKVDRKR